MLDGHGPAALAFVRSLGRAGHWVGVGISKGGQPYASRSRFCRRSVTYPSALEGVWAFVEAVATVAKEESIDLILPMSDATTWPLAQNANSFSGWTTLGVPDPRAVERSSDKLWAVSMAAELGIPAPPTAHVHSCDELAPTRDWGFPLVVKDRCSIRWSGDGGFPGTVRFAGSWDELITLVESRLARVGDVLVQKFTPGIGLGFAALVVEGGIRLPFQWQRLREKDPRGSGSSARCSIPIDSRVEEFSSRLLDRSGFRGIAMVEFKQNPRTGALSLMEINGRPWGSMQLPIYCGLDYPLILVDWLLEAKKPREHVAYRIGITARWLAADLVHLENLRHGPPPGWPAPYPPFWKNVLAVALPWYPGLKYDDFAAADFQPGLVDLGRWFRQRLSRIRPRSGGAP